MKNNNHKFAGWMLCGAALFLLISQGKLDLVVVLVPISLLLGYVISYANRSQDNRDEHGRKGIA
ncbi:MAG: hypothetical protein ACRD2U_12465 [Terriglobales bacterium]